MKNSYPSLPFVVGLSIAVLASLPVHSSELTDVQITDLISDKKITLETTWGAFPLVYRSSKQVVGDGSGLGLAKFFSPKETGKWWVASNQLCQKFPTWYKGKTFCFTLQRDGERGLLWERDDGYSGTARID